MERLQIAAFTGGLIALFTLALAAISWAIAVVGPWPVSLGLMAFWMIATGIRLDYKEMAKRK